MCEGDDSSGNDGRRQIFMIEMRKASEELCINTFFPFYPNEFPYNALALNPILYSSNAKAPIPFSFL